MTNSPFRFLFKQGTLGAQSAHNKWIIPPDTAVLLVINNLG